MARKSTAQYKRAPRSSPKDPSKYKKKTIRLRVSPEEYEVFTQKARDQGLTTSELIRSVLEAHNYMRTDSQE